MAGGLLQEEHARIRAMFAGGMPGDTSWGDLCRLVRTHFEREEAGLLKALAEHLPDGTGPLAVVREEHRVLRGLLAQVEADPPPEVGERLRTLLLSHFDKEEELLLPFARTHLSAEERIRCECEA